MPIDTPALVFDRSRIRANYRALKAALPEFTLAYAIKSNPLEEIIAILREEGSSFETASLQEIRYLTDLGIAPADIILSNPIKPQRGIDGSMAIGVREYSFDSVDELAKFENYKDQANLILRLQVPNEGSMWPLTGKFGIPDALWDELFAYMRDFGFPLAGFTFHVGSQCENAYAWRTAMWKAREAWHRAREFDLQPFLLNTGGGFPIPLGRTIPTAEAIADVIRTELEVFREEGLEIKRLFAEPGRFIAGDAGYLVTEVIGTSARTDKRWVFLDVGVFSGMMETIDGITYPYVSNASGRDTKASLCGPTCDSVDNMFETTMPSPKAGDHIVFSGAGSYTQVYQSNFNGFSGPNIYFRDSIESAQALLDEVASESKTATAH